MKTGAKEGCNYVGDGPLLPNYGWVQNTSNLSMVRDMVELIGMDRINHYEFMRRVYKYRTELEPDLKKWSYDARCRARAVVATGMIRLDRAIAGYEITELGKELLDAPKSTIIKKKNRVLTDEEKDIFKRGILTNPPVIQVLSLLYDAKRNGQSLSKYDIGANLGFAGDPGFTHLEPEGIVRAGGTFTDKEGDADKWARTILSWLVQVGWVEKSSKLNILGKSLQTYKLSDDAENAARYTSKSMSKYVPQEMLSSDKHPFAASAQIKRFAILKALKNRRPISIGELSKKLNDDGLSISEEIVRFELTNLSQAGFQIHHDQDDYCMKDNLVLDEKVIPDKIDLSSEDSIEKCIIHYATEYEDSIPPKLIDSLIRYGYTGKDNCAEFEGAVSRFFTFMGYHTIQLGQGNGRVADVIAKYIAPKPPRSYALIIDAKAYSKYNFNAGDVRKMKEYISIHGDELYEDRIPNHAFAFVSMDFVPEEKPLNEICEDTDVYGTAIAVDELFKLGDKTSKKLIEISDIFDSFTTNKRFVCPE